MLGPLRDKRLLWPAMMTLAGVILGIGLGSWQLQRRTWKEELIATIEARTGISALPAEAWPNLRCRTVQDVGLELSCEYMKVTLRGTWDHARERQNISTCISQFKFPIPGRSLKSSGRKRLAVVAPRPFPDQTPAAKPAPFRHKCPEHPRAFSDRPWTTSVGVV